MQTIAEVKLVCPECRRENEAERIYCHECGARLDRSKMAKIKSKEEDPKDAQRRLIDELLALFGGRGKLVMAHLVEAGEITLADVKEAEKALRKTARKDEPQ